MNDGEHLLAAIKAFPDDDGPRLIYADWLTDHGEPLRAAAIREQVAFARQPESAAKAMRSVAELLAANPHIFDQSETITQPIAIHATGPNDSDRIFVSQYGRLNLTWSRGFVDTVDGVAAEWFKHADTLIAGNPAIRRVVLANVPRLRFGDIHFERRQDLETRMVTLTNRWLMRHDYTAEGRTGEPYGLSVAISERELLRPRSATGHNVRPSAADLLDRRTAEARTVDGYLIAKWGYDPNSGEGGVKSFQMPAENENVMWARYNQLRDQYQPVVEPPRSFFNQITGPELLSPPAAFPTASSPDRPGSPPPSAS